MDPRSLISFGRRVAESHEPSELVDVSADALRESFHATVAMVVIRNEGSQPAASCSGQFPDPFLNADGAMSVGLDELRSLLAREGITVQRSAFLGSEPGCRGFILLGWDADGECVDGVDDEAEIELAADILHGVMERVALEGRLQAAQELNVELAEQLSGAGHLYMLGELASGVAHDFNNTLTTILGTTEWLLQNASIEDEAREDLTHIRTAATDAAGSAHRLQLAARQIPAYSGRLQRVPIDANTPGDTSRAECVDLSSIASHMRALSRQRWAPLVDRGLPLEFVVDAPPVAPVRASAPEIRELLLNLVFNAIDSMEDTGGQLLLQVREIDGHVQLSVSDQGTGIPDGVRARLFEPFFTTKGKRGSGLGLSMCWRIAHQHGGTLEVESRVDKGTTFTLTLPAVSREVALVEHAPSEGQRETRRVLLIDDQPDVRESVGDMLKALGHTVWVAADGKAGLRLVQEGTFDVVVTDLRMPGMDGLEVAKRVRALRPGVPIVLLTGWGTLFEHAEPEAVSVVLPKPPTLHGLSEAIARAATDVAA